LRWSYGVRLLAAADPETIPTAEGVDNGVLPDTPTIERSETGFPPAPYEPHQQRASSQWPEPDPTDVGDVPPRPAYTGPPIIVHTTSNRLLRPFASRRSTGVFHSFPNSPAPTPGPLPSIPATPSTNSSQTRAGTPDFSDEFAGTRVREVRGPSTWRKFKRQVRHGWATFNDFMTMPLWAAAASLVVALIQPVQHALDAHFPPVKNALNAAGQCSIPITLIVLGAYFYTPPEDQKGQIRLDGPERDLHMPPADEEGGAATTRASKRLSQVSVVGSVRSMLGLDQLKDGRADHNALLAPSNESARPGETKTVWVAVLSRMVITPLLLLPGMALSAYFDWHQVLEEYVFSCVSVSAFIVN
jgi:auxin efflux carrier family protein